MKHKIMEAMRRREERRELDGRVEIDDAYLGGERIGGKPGRGSENKVPIVAAVQTTPEGAAGGGVPAPAAAHRGGSGGLRRRAHRDLGHRGLRRPVVLSRHDADRRRPRAHTSPAAARPA